MRIHRARAAGVTSPCRDSYQKRMQGLRHTCGYKGSPGGQKTYVPGCPKCEEKRKSFLERQQRRDALDAKVVVIFHREDSQN